jgi:SAM-dependent methyltransferase
MITADDYESWYRSPRGRWIGETEFRLIRDMLQPKRGGSLLDVGCGTGYFTRRLAGDFGLDIVGLDPNASWLAYARAHGVGRERYCVGRAERLPFGDRSFDYAASIAALCFVEAIEDAVRELVRVTRRRFVIGLLNRRSLLYWQKGRAGGTGAYRGARWHTAAEVRALFAGIPLAGLTLRSAIVLPSAGPTSRLAERLIADGPCLGAFIAVAGTVRP